MNAGGEGGTLPHSNDALYVFAYVCFATSLKLLKTNYRNSL